MKKVRLSGAAIASFALLAGFAIQILPAQTTLTMADPEALAKYINNKSEIERNIMLAAPGSLDLAREGLVQSKVISDDDKNALLDIARGISAILYPSPAPPPLVSKNAPPRLNGNDLASGFYLDPSLKNINPLYSVCLTQLVEAFQGRIFSAPRGSEAAFLSEILPALAIFRTDDKDVARAALGYIERFDFSGSYVSVIPGLVRARFARLSGDKIGAYVNYKQVLDSYPDVWPARLELGVISLELDKPVNALAFLSPLIEGRKNDRAVIAPYAIALYRNGKFGEAEPFVKRGLEFDPNSPELTMIAAHISIDKNDFAAAQPLLESLGRKTPTDRMYLYLKALYAKGQGRNEEALKWARKALQTNPEDPELMVLLAGVLLKGPESGHEEAKALCAEAKKRFAADESAVATGSGLPSMSPLKIAMREEAKGEATRLIMLDAYDHQDWYAAAAMLESSSEAGLDKSIVATILRKSGRTKEAIAFSSEWYKEAPQSEPAAEAYLRSLAAAGAGIGLASAAPPSVSDAGSGLLGLMGGSGSGAKAAGIASGQPSIISLVLQLLSGNCSSSMRSYLFYLRGTLQSDPDAAIDSYRMALLERADNIEAIAALAKAYAKKNDVQKALFYIKQAKAIGIDDKILAAELQKLEAAFPTT